MTNTINSTYVGWIYIQPCDSNEIITYYVTKYVIKSEPTGIDNQLAKAIRTIQLQDGNFFFFFLFSKPTLNINLANFADVS